MTIRLNKVTRDLNVGITTVVEFLQKKGYEIEASPNAKITEEQYAVLVKEFSKDKNLKIESEKFIQERQNKERNKPTVSIPEPKKEEVVKTVIPDESLPKFKPVGKIDLDNLNKRPAAPKAVEPVQVVEEKTYQPNEIKESVSIPTMNLGLSRLKSISVMKRVAENRWINAKNMNAKILVTECPAEYIMLSKTKPEGIELLTVEEAVLKCL